MFRSSAFMCRPPPWPTVSLKTVNNMQANQICFWVENQAENIVDVSIQGCLTDSEHPVCRKTPITSAQLHTSIPGSCPVRPHCQTLSSSTGAAGADALLKGISLVVMRKGQVLLPGQQWCDTTLMRYESFVVSAFWTPIQSVIIKPKTLPVCVKSFLNRLLKTLWGESCVFTRPCLRMSLGVCRSTCQFGRLGETAHPEVRWE